MNKTRIFAAVLAVSGALLATKAGAQTAPPTGAQTAPPTGAQTGAPTVELVETQGGWGLYADTATPKQVCFVAAPPQAVEPLGANRGPIYFYVSAWPKDGVKAEPSVKVGYPIAADKGITVTIGADTFKLFAKGERGFVSEPAEEQRLIEAMKSGETALVKATSARGTATTDTYALSGLGAALTKMGEVCQ